MKKHFLFKFIVLSELYNYNVNHRRAITHFVFYSTDSNNPKNKNNKNNGLKTLQIEKKKIGVTKFRNY